jgi:hypothetical protein
MNQPRRLLACSLTAAWVLWHEVPSTSDGGTAFLHGAFDTRAECEKAMAPNVAEQRAARSLPKVRDIPGGAVFKLENKEVFFRYRCLPAGTPPPGVKLESTRP